MSPCAERLEDQVFEVICYMVTSAANLVRETKAYGPLRLLDASSRLITVLENNGVSSGRLDTLRSKIEQGRAAVMTDESAFEKMLEGLVLDIVNLMEAPSHDCQGGPTGSV